MNYLLHRHRCPGHIVPIPEDLNELMADISKEVIRNQPKNVPEFIADFLESMLMTRECTVIAQTTVDDIMDYAMDVMTFYVTTTVPESKAKHVVQLFQCMLKDNGKYHLQESAASSFDEEKLCCRLMKECDLNQNDAMKAVEIFKNAYKNFYYRQKEYQPTLTTGTEADWDSKVKEILGTYARAKPTQEQMNRAARCLQSAFRGYRVRRRLQTKKENAIVTIQSIARGYLTRKHLAEQGQYTHETTDTQDFDKNIEQQQDLTYYQDVKDNQDLTDVEAATMIQNIYRGHKTRHVRKDDFKIVPSLKSIRRQQDNQMTARKKKTIILPESSNTSRQSMAKNSKKSPSLKNESSLESLLVVNKVELTPRVSKESTKKN